MANFGQPTVASRGVRVKDVLRRVRGGEPTAQVADDYGLPLPDVESLAAFALSA
ncbi:MAG: DUF433 domain-containing protein [Bifidobacteriaceae bacterium]|jgi:uncharacterized protein (DUF433 family)|nr:DUF433 domain-containing protein [Bifidobacteriaceae bacterium]